MAGIDGIMVTYVCASLDLENCVTRFSEQVIIYCPTKYDYFLHVPPVVTDKMVLG
jgi:hypothetical protein